MVDTPQEADAESVKDAKLIAIGSDAIDHKLNSSLSEVPRQIFIDQKLLGHLTSRGNS